MLPRRYEFVSGRNFRLFEFYSEGPKGRIRKVVLYSYMGSQDGDTYYNLGFGDYNPASKEINDLIVSDNSDRDKILATVAATATEFTRHYPGSMIVVKGSTPARTRLYQMKIAGYYTAISELFDIQCQTKGGKLVRFSGGRIMWVLS